MGNYYGLDALFSHCKSPLVQLTLSRRRISRDDFRLSNHDRRFRDIRRSLICILYGFVREAIRHLNEDHILIETRFVQIVCKFALFMATFLCLGFGVFLPVTIVRQRLRQSASSDTEKDELQRAVSQVKHREWLYHNILWWYLLPGAIGWGVVVYEEMFKDGVSVFEISYVAIALAFFASVYLANRRVAVTRFEPWRRRLEELVRELELSS